MPVDDETLNRVTWKIPNALALVGSRSGDEWNAMTTSWITQLSMDPVLIGIGVDNHALTCRLIDTGGSFTVNLWPSEDTRVFVKFSKPATKEDMTLNGRAISTASTGAPIFDEALAWMDCAVRQRIDLGTHTLFIGEVVDAAVNETLDDRWGQRRQHERHPHEVRRRQTPLNPLVARGGRPRRMWSTGGTAYCSCWSKRSSSSSPVASSGASSHRPDSTPSAPISTVITEPAT